MSATVLHLPTSVEPTQALSLPGLNLSPEEVQDAAGGYVRAADQLRELQARGFTRAYIPKVGRKRVILERAHYEAVVRGQFGQAEATQQQTQRPAARANRAGLERLFKQKARK